MSEGIAHDAPLLRIHAQASESPGPATVAVFEVLRGLRQSLKIAEMPTSQLGLPDLIQSTEDVDEDRFQIPDDLRRKLVGVLNQVTEPKDPVCLLHLPAPHGYLHLIPWERLLFADLVVPIVRLPRYELVPRAKWPLRVAVVAGRSPRRPPFPVTTMVADAVRHWCNAYHDESLTVDVFVPAAEVDAVRNALSGRPEEQASDINVHEPPEDPEIGWRKWVGTALGGWAVDILHLIGHGAFRAERGILALPRIRGELPERSIAVEGDRHEVASEVRERSIDANELCAALTGMGAWSLLITAPVENASPAALRDICTAVTETRPGVVILHQCSTTGDADGQAEESLRMVTGQVRGTRMPDISCWHPLISAWFVRRDTSSAEGHVESLLTEPDGTSALISPDTADVLAAPNAPVWVASGARTLETLHAQVVSSASSAPNPDAVEALRSVSKSFNQQVREWSHQHGLEGPW